jgi:hypothetical protein
VVRIETKGAITMMPACETARADAYPEFTDYSGSYYDGCDLHPHCLTCPLPACRYDMPYGVATLKAEVRDTRVRALRSAGYTAAAIAKETGIQVRSVWRILGRAREAA